MHLEKLREDFIVCFKDLEKMHQSLSRSKSLSDYWSNVSTATLSLGYLYPKLNTAVEPFLLVFSSLYMVEANAVLTK